MCFTVRRGERAMIASEDIVCWKVLRKKTKDGYGASFNGIIHKYFFYKPGILQEQIPLRIQKGWYEREIHEGYHSYQTKSEAKFSLGHREAIYKFIIPKGTRYYKDDKAEEYVSETIMMCPLRKPKPKTYKLCV